jgi:hypothetical protein
MRVTFGVSLALWNIGMETYRSPLARLALLFAAFCAVTLAFSHNASADTIPLIYVNGTSQPQQTLGYVLYGIPSGDSNRQIYVNRLISLTPGTTNYPADGQTYTRTIFNPGPGYPNYPTATLVNDGKGTSIPLGSGGIYSYLFAKYDGPNQGSVVWYVGNLTGTITISSTWGKYGLSTWTLFGPGGGPPPPSAVPDGGATLMLFGAAQAVLAVSRRWITRKPGRGRGPR